MAFQTNCTYTFQPKSTLGAQSFFEVRKVELESHCAYHENEISAYYKIFFIENGSGFYTIDFKQIQITDAGLFFLSPGQVFSVEEEAMQTAYQICFDKDFYCVETHGKEIACNGMLFNNVHRATMLNLLPEESTLFKQLIVKMIEELRQPNLAAHQAMIETQLRFFIIEALRTVEKKKEATVGQTNVETEDEPSRLAAEYISLVEKDFRKTHSMSDYAAKLFVEPKTLSKNLQKAGYPTPKQVLHDRILLQAKRELRFSDKNIKEIAYDLGFEDPAYFSRLFSKNEGISPLSYRQG